MKRTRNKRRGGGKTKKMSKAVRATLKRLSASKKKAKKSKKGKRTRGKKTAWQIHLMKVFAEMRKKNPTVKLSQAFKPAAKSYKKISP